MTPRVAVLIVAYDSGDHLQRALDGLAAQTYRDFEIVLWDNASSDGAAAAARLPENARYVRSEENLGFAGGNNRAAGLVDVELLALLNPDAMPEPAWLERLVAAVDARADAVMAASLQLRAQEPERLDGAGDVYHATGVPYRGGYGARVTDTITTGEVFGPCGAAALYRKAAFDALGGFDERFFCYVEDVDLAFRLRLAGGRCVFAADAVVRHVGSATTGRRSEFAVYHGVRNRLWAFAKNLPARAAPICVPVHVLVVAVLWALALRRSRREASAFGRGLRDGLRGLKPFLRERRRVMRSAGGAWAVLRAMTWSPFRLARRGADIRAYPEDS